MYLWKLPGVVYGASMGRLWGLNQARATRCGATCCPCCGGEDKIHSHSFRASWCAPAGPLHNVKETAPWRCIRFIAITPTTSELAVGVITTKRPQLSSRPFLSLYAERTRFELAVGLPLRQFSKLLVSATHPPLQCFVLNCFIKRVQRYGFFCYFQKKSAFFDEIFFEAEAGRCQAMLHVWGRVHGGTLTVRA